MGNIDETIDELEQWAAGQNGVFRKCGAWKERKFLEMFVKRYNLDINKAKKQLQSFCDFRVNLSEWYRGRDILDDTIQSLMDAGSNITIFDENPLDETTIVVIRCGAHDPYKSGLEDVIKFCFMVIDLGSIVKPDVAGEGIHIVFDMSNMGFRHSLQFRPTPLRNVAFGLLECYFINVRAVHFINITKTAQSIVYIVKGFFRSAIQEKIFIHGHDLSSLHEHISPEVLPVEMGGYNKTLQDLKRKHNSEMSKYRDWFLKLEKLEFGI